MQAAGWWMLAAAAVAGTIADGVPQRSPVQVGGYRMLAADLHVHTFPFSASTLAPWDMVVEARRQGLDAIAITGHNETFSGKTARWFSRRLGGPTVLAGEEIHGPAFHVVALGIEHTISWRLSAAAAIDEVHRQGGVAIAAHPTANAWPAFPAEAMEKLDGAEVVQPAAFTEEFAREMREFQARSGAAAIGSSDWHGMAPVGLCRTYIFATDASAEAILDAIRSRRTVVVDRGRVYGDLALARHAGDRLGQERPPGSLPKKVSAAFGIAGLLLVAVSGLMAEKQSRAARSSSNPMR